MDPNTIAFIAAASALSGILLGWIGKARTIRQDAAADATRDATLQTDMAYVKRGIDDLRIDIKIQNQKYDSLAETVIRQDESLKSAHKRIDKLEAKQS